MTSPGNARGVQRDTTIMTQKANATVHVAGSPSSTAGHPPRPTPAMEATTAAEEATPPATSPARAPTQVRRDHQIPRMSNGPSDDPAMAKAHPTRTLMENEPTNRPMAVTATPTTPAETRKTFGPPASRSWR